MFNKGKRSFGLKRGKGCDEFRIANFESSEATGLGR